MDIDGGVALQGDLAMGGAPQRIELAAIQHLLSCG
jgi:hypothetical protein